MDENNNTKPDRKEELPFDPNDFIVQPFRISLNDFEIEMPDGTVVHPNYGQSIWVEPWAASMDATMDTRYMQRLNDPGMTPGEQETWRRGFYEMLSTQVIAWDATDNRREPYDQPYQNPEVFAQIGAPLCWHIFNAINGRDQKKDASSKSTSRGTSSTASGRARKTR